MSTRARRFGKEGNACVFAHVRYKYTIHTYGGGREGGRREGGREEGGREGKVESQTHQEEKNGAAKHTHLVFRGPEREKREKECIAPTKANERE